MLLWWLALLGFLALQPGCSSKCVTNKVVCYYGSWAGYRSGNGKFEPENIDPTLCTHIIFTFIGISATTGEVMILDPWNDLPSGKNGIERFINLTQINPEVKLVVSCGGWNEGSTKYSAMVNSDTRRAAFVKSIIEFLDKYGFHGLDLAWEYPGTRGGIASDKEGFIKLLQELRLEFGQKYLLTVAVGAAHSLVTTAYDVPAMSKCVDFFNCMTYDIHVPDENVTGHNTPLYSSSVDTTVAAKQLNINATIHCWLNSGAPPEKLCMGTAAYGHTFTLVTPAVVGPGAPSSGQGNAGPYTQEAGCIGYNEICELQQQGGWTTVWDEEQRVPYTIKDSQWITYENERSLKEKTEYAIQMGLGGIMIWSIETDDFGGVCGGGKYPLLKAIDEELKAGCVETTTSSTTSTTTKSARKKKPSRQGPSCLCKTAGFVRDPDDWHVFYSCQRRNKGYFAHKFTCPADLVFDMELNVCNYEHDVHY